jgi:hypothetical protein
MTHHRHRELEGVVGGERSVYLGERRADPGGEPDFGQVDILPYKSSRFSRGGRPGFI